MINFHWVLFSLFKGFSMETYSRVNFSLCLFLAILDRSRTQRKLYPREKFPIYGSGMKSSVCLIFVHWHFVIIIFTRCYFRCHWLVNCEKIQCKTEFTVLQKSKSCSLLPLDGSLVTRIHNLGYHSIGLHLLYSGLVPFNRGCQQRYEIILWE